MVRTTNEKWGNKLPKPLFFSAIFGPLIALAVGALVMWRKSHHERA
jgi:hypothetical protein